MCYKITSVGQSIMMYNIMHRTDKKKLYDRHYESQILYKYFIPKPDIKDNQNCRTIKNVAEILDFKKQGYENDRGHLSKIDVILENDGV